MNLAAIMLRCYIDNPTSRTESGTPLFVLPNARILVLSKDHDPFPLFRRGETVARRYTAWARGTDFSNDMIRTDSIEELAAWFAKMAELPVSHTREDWHWRSICLETDSLSFEHRLILADAQIEWHRMNAFEHSDDRTATP